MAWALLAFVLLIGGSLGILLGKKQSATLSILVTIILVFIGQVVLFSYIAVPELNEEFYQDLAFRPVHLVSWRAYTLATAMFLHGGFFHLIGNSLVLFLLGLPFENRVGRRNFLAIYLGGGLIAGLGSALFPWRWEVFGLGASGAISAMMGAFLVLYPRDETPMLIGPLILPRVPVYLSVGLFFALETFLVFVEPASGVAHEVHIAGLAAGIALGPILVRKRAIAAGEPLERLEPLAIGERLQEVLRLAREETLPDVRRAWLEEFARLASCPACRGSLTYAPGRFSSSCGWVLTLK